MVAPRRSARARKQAQSYYEDAKKEVNTPRKRRASPKAEEEDSDKEDGSDVEREEEEEEQQEEEQEEEEEEQQNEEEDKKPEKMSESEPEPEEEEEDDDEEEEEEEYTPAKTSKRRAPASASRTTPKKRSPASARKSPKHKSAAKPRKSQASKTAGTTGTAKARAGPSRKTGQSALQTLAKKFLSAEETPDESLVAALLGAGKKRTKGASSSSVSGLSKFLRGKETPYTANLVEICKRVVEEHHDDPNATQVALYNLLFRSVGATYESLLDPAEVDLEGITDEDMAECVKAVVHSMEETPLEQVPLVLMENVDGSSQKVSVAAREYHNIYQQFWYLLGVTALSDSLSGRSAKKSRRSSSKSPSKKKEDDSDDNEEDEKSDEESDQDSNDDDDSSKGGSPQGLRFQIEMVREIQKRVVELSMLSQDDLRAGMTMALHQLSIAILERTVELRDKLLVAERQLHVAKKSRMKRKAQALEAQTDLWSRMCTELEDMVSTTMSVFAKRYKDIHPQIRADCMRTLGRFIVTRPDMFLKNAYLKYMGWMLSDKSASVRESAIGALLAPFQRANQDRASSSKGGQRGKRSSKDADHSKVDISLMGGMVEKFCRRLAECTMDVDVTVQERALELLLAMSHQELMDDIEDDAMWKEINDRALTKEGTSPTVRRLALLFVLEQLEAFDSRSGSRGTLSESDTVERLQTLAAWISSSISPQGVENVPFDRVALVISSLRLLPEHASLVTSYSALLKALQECGNNESASQNKRRLEAVQRRVLLEMLVAGVEQEMSAVDGSSSLEGVVDPSMLDAIRAQENDNRDSSKKKTKTSSKNTEALQEKLTIDTLQALPNLLSAFKTETDLIRGLTTLPKYFLPSVLNTSNQKKHFSALLEELSALFQTATDPGVLSNCCLSLTLLAKGDHTRSSEALVVLKRDTSSICAGLLRLLEEKTEIDDPAEMVDVELSIGLSLKRLSIISKRWPLASLLNEDGPITVESLASSIATSLAQDLADRKLVTDEEDEESEVLVPEIWETAPHELHENVSESVIAGLSLILSLVAWSLREQLMEKSDEEKDADPIVRLRDLLINLTAHAFEVFVEDNDTYEMQHRTFVRKIQVHAEKIAGDLRTLFHKEWAGATDPFLRAIAYEDDSRLIGGAVRFLQSQEDKLRSLADAETHPVRLLEAHMAGLRQVFEDWAEQEPEEPQSDHPSEEEMEEYEEAQKAHKTRFELMEQTAKRLSSSLGVGKLSNKDLKPAMLGFCREGVRFAFSTDGVNGGEPLFLGARLPFLRVLSKYLSWIRKDKSHVEVLRDDFNEKEAELRNHPDYSEVFEDDLEALTQFRQAGNMGAFLVEDDDDKTKDGVSAGAGMSAASSGMRRRLSHASSISSIASKASTHNSLSPVREEKDVEDAGEDEPSKKRKPRKLAMQSPIEETEEEGGMDTPGTSKSRKRTPEKDAESVISTSSKRSRVDDKNKEEGDNGSTPPSSARPRKRTKAATPASREETDASTRNGDGASVLSKSSKRSRVETKNEESDDVSTPSSRPRKRSKAASPMEETDEGKREDGSTVSSKDSPDRKGDKDATTPIKDPASDESTAQSSKDAKGPSDEGQDSPSATLTSPDPTNTTRETKDDDASKDDASNASSKTLSAGEAEGDAADEPSAS